MANKKVLALLVAVLMVLPLFAACAQPAAAPAPEAAPAAEAAPAEEAAPAPEAAPAEEKTPVTLEVSIVETDFLDAWDTLIEPKFEAEYPWIDLEDVGTGENKSDFHTARSAAGDLPPVMQVDLAPVYTDNVDAGKILSVADYEVASKIPESYKGGHTHNGVYYGITQGAAFDAIYYNMAILKDAGIEAAPTNWDEFIACCEAVKAKGYDAVVLGGGKTTTGWMPFESIAANVMGDAYEAGVRDGSIDFTTAPAVAERLDTFAKYVMTGSTNNQEEDITATMADGKCAMAIAGNWQAKAIIEAITTATGDEANAGMAVIPVNDAGKAAYLAACPESAFGVTAVDDPNLAEARDLFFNWIWQPENYAMIQNARGTIPVMSGIPEELIVLPDAAKAFATAKSEATAFGMSFNIVTGDVNGTVNTFLNGLWGGNTDAATALAGIQEAIAADPKF